MKLKRKKRTTVPPLAGGTYLGICIGIIDIGEQYNQNFKNYADKLMLLFEISGETVNVDGEDKPRWLSREYTASLNEKLRCTSILVAWRSRDFTEGELDTDGDGFDIESMLGQPCMLTVIVKDGTTVHTIALKTLQLCRRACRLRQQNKNCLLTTLTSVTKKFSQSCRNGSRTRSRSLHSSQRIRRRTILRKRLPKATRVSRKPGRGVPNMNIPPSGEFQQRKRLSGFR